MQAGEDPLRRVQRIGADGPAAETPALTRLVKLVRDLVDRSDQGVRRVSNVVRRRLDPRRDVVDDAITIVGLAYDLHQRLGLRRRRPVRVGRGGTYPRELRVGLRK